MGVFGVKEAGRGGGQKENPAKFAMIIIISSYYSCSKLFIYEILWDVVDTRLIHHVLIKSLF